MADHRISTLLSHHERLDFLNLLGHAGGEHLGLGVASRLATADDDIVFDSDANRAVPASPTV